MTDTGVVPERRSAPITAASGEASSTRLRAGERLNIEPRCLLPIREPLWKPSGKKKFSSESNGPAKNSGVQGQGGRSDSPVTTLQWAPPDPTVAADVRGLKEGQDSSSKAATCRLFLRQPAWTSAQLDSKLAFQGQAHPRWR